MSCEGRFIKLDGGELEVTRVFAPVAKRNRAWATLAQHLDKARLARIAGTEPLSALPALADDIVAGRIRGRVVIDIAG
ncbi:hypothetical protein [uncultured Paracoccus sp.]|uniref:hypothetical protein n=1 Tax=uncultured Paracoccus sp. TaxID=189685 RepID=UPI002609CB7F|nr:hypothetical protein [uncultured Paracoccus sp.]